MCEKPYRIYGHHGWQNHGMICCRQFLTKDEKIRHLEEYKKWLEQEAKGVSETIDEIKEAS